MCCLLNLLEKKQLLFLKFHQKYLNFLYPSQITGKTTGKRLWGGLGVDGRTILE